MTHQEAFLGQPIDTGDEAAQVVRECDAKLEVSGASISRLQESLREETETYEAIRALRDEAASLLGVDARLRNMRDHAARYGIPRGPSAHQASLHLVPDGKEEASKVGETASGISHTSDSHSGSENPSGPGPASCMTSPEPQAARRPAPVAIRSKAQQNVLTALASRPESEPPWGSEEIAKALGIPKEAKARKALRNCLQALVVSGALERVTREDDHHVYYRPLMNWEFV
ncbi:hypothetical protein ACIO13_21730 [Streptomyces sp. NPDC087425]|uniref:hypothetical protein n=1 Tax=Streptomyces sp. NPDC087425 TaxID=3365787 RepID=UPI00381F589D